MYHKEKQLPDGESLPFLSSQLYLRWLMGLVSCLLQGGRSYRERPMDLLERVLLSTRPAKYSWLFLIVDENGDWFPV